MKYMIQVMAALKNLVGIIGAGFEMLQDFVDEIFQGILPASFVAKYAKEGFQQAIEARYSKPTSERDDRGQARKNVPTMANARPVSRVARVRNSLYNAGKYVGALASSPVGRGTAILTAGFLIHDIVTDVLATEQAKRMAELWPDNFTLFGYDEIVNKFDDMQAFLEDDSSCVVMRQYERLNLTMQFFPCLDASVARYTEANPLTGTTSIDATQCWADAAPSLGQNALFSCGSASTCCSSFSSSCSERIPCGTCPEPALPQTNRYGCHGLLRKCACGTPRTTVDKCSANLHCDAEAQCELVSSMSTTSYGSLPCKLCPSQSQVLCLLKTGQGMPGGCVCMLDTAVQFDLCSDRSGAETGVDATRLCGYLHGQQQQSRVSWEFDMENLMVVSCAQASYGVCSTVYNTNMGGGRTSSTLRMVVATRLRGTQTAQRRLLSEPEDAAPVHADPLDGEYEGLLMSEEELDEVLAAPGWDAAAPPCSLLVRAYQEKKEAMAVLDKFELRRCGFWRLVGRRVLARYNLTDTPLGSAEHETFLVSGNDLIRTAMSSSGAGLMLLRNPGVFGAALLYHPWMRPVRALGVRVANHVEYLRWMREIDGDVHEALFGDDAVPMPDEEASLPSQTQHEDTEGGNLSSHAPRRKLMGVVDSANNIVAQYSAQSVILAPKAADVRGKDVPTRIAGAWSTATFAWPPVYDYRLQAGACPLAMSALEIGRQGVGVLGMYFRNFRSGKAGKPIDRSLRGNLPSWEGWIDGIKLEQGAPASLVNASRSWASWTFHKALEVMRVHPSHLVAFFTENQKWTLRWILETSIKCDLAATVTCSRHDKDLVMSCVIYVLGYFLVVRPLSRGLGVGFLPIAYILAAPSILLWYVFGMGPSCFPMVPTCLLTDLIATMERLVPPALMFPEDLRCDTGGVTALNQTCLRGCEELGFRGWEDPLAFAICDTDPRTCRYMAREVWPEGTGVGMVDTLGWLPLRSALGRALKLVDAGSASGLAGHRLCTWVSFVTTTPVLALLGAGAIVAWAAWAAALDLLPSAVAFAGQLFVFASA